MSIHTFSNWLRRELQDIRFVLIALYEEHDHLVTEKAPALTKEYMEKIGDFEEGVIKEEVECQLQQTKLEMVQACINRREPIDEAVIDAALDEKRKELYHDLMGEDPWWSRRDHEVSGHGEDYLKELYTDIVRGFHPQTHPELSETQRELFQHGVDAYRRRDLDALRLVHEMLCGAFGSRDNSAFLTLEMTVELTTGDVEMPKVVTTDYSLAEKIFPQFASTMEEGIIQQEIEQCRNAIALSRAALHDLKQCFPFCAQEMLANPNQLEEYRAELEQRLAAAKSQRSYLEYEIRTLIESVSEHETRNAADTAILSERTL